MSAPTGAARREETRPSDDAPSDPPVHQPALRLLRGGIALVVAGTALTLAGILAAPLFRPGTFVILIGLILAAAAGVWSVVPTDSRSSKP